MNKILELDQFLQSYVSSYPEYTKEDISRATAEQFRLTRKRSVFHRKEFSVRFSYAKEKSFSNTVLSLSGLREYDHIPFVVCVVRPQRIELLLANSTFLKKISHSSQQFRIDNIRGSFLGHDIMRVYEGIDNKPEKFEALFDTHIQFTWEENVIRLVEKSNAIVPTGERFEPSEQQKENILHTANIAQLLSRSAEYIQLGNELTEMVKTNFEMILQAAEIDNVNLRGNRIEQIITQAGNFHSLDDITRTLSIGPEIKVDIKTKILTLTSSPKAYNIEKVLKVLALGNTVFSFFFIGINPERQYVVTCLVSILDETILKATRVQFHWAGRNSRGVTQLTGDLSGIFSPDYSETIDIKKAQDFLQYLIDLKPPLTED